MKPIIDSRGIGRAGATCAQAAALAYLLAEHYKPEPWLGDALCLLQETLDTLGGEIGEVERQIISARRMCAADE